MRWGEGFGVTDSGTVKKMGVLGDAIFLWNKGINLAGDPLQFS